MREALVVVVLHLGGSLIRQCMLLAPQMAPTRALIASVTNALMCS